MSAADSSSDLVATAGDAERAVVVVGLRADFSGECAAYPRPCEAAGGQPRAGRPDEAPMSSDARSSCPPAESGSGWSRDWPRRFVAEVGDEPGGLPLLSTALVELWMARSDGWLRLETLAELGGVRGAVARLADSSYNNLADDERSAARRLFMRLASTGEDGMLTRRVVPLSELDLQRDPVLAAVVERLTGDRLLTAHDASIEVAHEALLREWPRFQAWLTEDMQGRELREHLTQSAKRWAAADRDAGRALPGRSPDHHAGLGGRPAAGAERARTGVSQGEQGGERSGAGAPATNEPPPQGPAGRCRRSHACRGRGWALRPRPAVRRTA